MRFVKWLLIITIGLVITLALLNPTNEDFDHYLEANGIKEKGGRTKYYLVYSEFEVVLDVTPPSNGELPEPGEPESKVYRTDKYLGFFKNFRLITE